MYTHSILFSIQWWDCDMFFCLRPVWGVLCVRWIIITSPSPCMSVNNKQQALDFRFRCCYLMVCWCCQCVRAFSYLFIYVLVFSSLFLSFHFLSIQLNACLYFVFAHFILSLICHINWHPLVLLVTLLNSIHLPK